MPQHTTPSVRPSGFTLIEVMITVAIVGILAAIALPAYRDYILRGQLVDGTNMLAAGRANMERYYQDNRTYAVVGSFSPPCTGTAGKFTMSCGTPTSTTYTLTATAPGLATYTIDQTGTQTTTAVPPNWSLPNPATCWVMKRGQTC